MSSPKTIPVIVRCCNDRQTIAATLNGIRAQSVPARIVVFDNDSDDGTTEIAHQLADEVVRVPRGTYVPGRVLNQAMGRCDGDIVVFLNSDCTPLDEHWLARLLDAMAPETVVAAFSRQLPRIGCHPLEALDIERCYGSGRRQRRSRHTFSMASSAVRRDVWQSAPFDEALQYSEDVHWTWQARRHGYRIAYAPESQVFHSHNYTLGQLLRRYRGEGRAEATIFSWTLWQRHVLRYSLLPWVRSVASDWSHCVRHGLWRHAVLSPLYRAVQAIGRRQGFLAAECQGAAT